MFDYAPMLQSPDLCSEKLASASHIEKGMPVFDSVSAVVPSLGLTNLEQTVCDQKTSQSYALNQT